MRNSRKGYRPEPEFLWLERMINNILLMIVWSIDEVVQVFFPRNKE